jgi:copper homeostasis protein (lipoprotein)
MPVYALIHRFAWPRCAGRLIATLLLAGSVLPHADAQPAASAPSSTAPADASYAGTLPCADCAGQQIVLTLFADQSFRMRTRYLGDRLGMELEVHELGRWARTDAGTIELRGGREAPMRFSPTAGGALRLLDTQGRPIVSTLDYELQRQAEVDRVNGPMRLRGMYAYMADAAVLTECLSGKRWPVSTQGAHLALERAVLAHRAKGGGDWVLATLNARFVMREPEPGLPAREMLWVESFDRLWPGETCAADAPATAPLLNTRWRVVEIDGQPVVVDAGRREPYLQLSGDGNRVRGFGGCSRLSGRFEQGSDGFLFKGLAGTHGACMDSTGAQEARFIDALNATASRRIVGDALHLRDAQGRVRLRFEALYLR